MLLAPRGVRLTLPTYFATFRLNSVPTWSRGKTDYNLPWPLRCVYLEISICTYRLITRKAVGQLCSTASMSHNLQQCQVLIKKAVAAGAKVRLLQLALILVAQSIDLTRSTRPSSSQKQATILPLRPMRRSLWYVRHRIATSSKVSKVRRRERDCPSMWGSTSQYKGERRLRIP